MLWNCKGLYIKSIVLACIWYWKNAWTSMSSYKMITRHPLWIAPKCKLNAANVLMHLQHAVTVLQYLNVFIGYSWMEFPIHTNTVQCHLSAQSGGAHLCAPGQQPAVHSGWWLCARVLWGYLLRIGFTFSAAQQMWSQGKLSLFAPRNNPAREPGAREPGASGQEPRDLFLNWRRVLTGGEMFSFAASSLHNLKCLSSAGT